MAEQRATSGRPRRTARRLWIALCLALGFTGAGQMPIFKRYYLADLPGLAWTADYMLLHTAHTLLAAVFLAWAGAWAGAWLVRRERVAALGAWRVAVVAGLAATGLARVVKNLSGVWLPPDLVLAVDWAHLALALAFGALGAAALLRGAPYPATAGR
ncbi:hypothetical protein [Desulfocurvus vexinensis]|uniref:hypothetical protein n=1 Tax=Desulfocurvus vexinensis TaxID=399548 RepID=UPI0004B0C61C|nr:hypothetical protein [Desulfocurvus vexinensis]